MSSIAKRIKHYRKKKGLTMVEVAKELKITADNYSKYESGTRTPKDERLLALSNIFDVSYNTLHEGVERNFVDLLYQHALRAAMGNVESFKAFTFDFESNEAYHVISDFFYKGEQEFAKHNDGYYRKFVENPTIDSLITLYKKHLLPDANANTLAKWVFCVAVWKYLKEKSAEDICCEAEKYSENIDGFTFFAIKVFVPYLAFIINAVNLCMNTTIDDFEKAFIYFELSSEFHEDNIDG